MTLRLTNTLTKQTELFSPIKPKQVSIYCCGVTVYDLCHLGHARSYIAWDVLRRYFIWQGYKVNFVQNFTDIDDKIIAKAQQEGCEASEISERNIKEFHYDMDALGIIRPNRMPKATRCLHGIISMIKTLESKGSAYSVDGDVYFSVMKYADYGKLSRRELTDQLLNASGRITSQEKAQKDHPFDFALWKKAKENESSFDSPWGQGRPGWHIECSAMVLEELGETIDIHLGGADLIFPHHENEIAQSESATGKHLANFWLHNGMVNVGGQKMSKSLGNFTTIRDLLKEGISAMTLRLFVLQAHYRKPLDFTKTSLEAASKGWAGLNKALCLGLLNHEELGWPQTSNSTKITESDSRSELFSDYYQLFLDALEDDLNTSVALSVLFNLARPLRVIAKELEYGELDLISKSDKKELFERWKLLIKLSRVLGLQPEIFSKTSSQNNSNLQDSDIQEAINERNAAKLAKNYAKADKIRSQLREEGIELIDKPGGHTDWIKN